MLTVEHNRHSFPLTNDHNSSLKLTERSNGGPPLSAIARWLIVCLVNICLIIGFRLISHSLQWPFPVDWLGIVSFTGPTCGRLGFASTFCLLKSLRFENQPNGFRFGNLCLIRAIGRYSPVERPAEVPDRDQVSRGGNTTRDGPPSRRTLINFPTSCFASTEFIAVNARVGGSVA